MKAREKVMWAFVVFALILCALGLWAAIPFIGHTLGMIGSTVVVAVIVVVFVRFLWWGVSK